MNSETKKQIESIRKQATQARIDRDKIDDCFSPEWHSAQSKYTSFCIQAMVAEKKAK